VTVRVSGSVTARVPASTANLGSGYDSFGLALALYDDFEAWPADSWSVEVDGEGAGSLSTGPRNRVAQAMAAAFAAAGDAGRAARIRCENGVPTGRGLGSSSAAIVGGLVLADGLLGGALGEERLFELAVELEGHPDNVAAALFGGFTVCWDDGEPKAARLQPGGGLAVVAVVSERPLSTASARKLLPEDVPHSDAAFNVGRAGLLVAGITLGRPDLTGPGLGDRLHEPYRAGAVPDFDAVCDVLIDAGADGAALSGAGPTVVGFVQEPDDDAAFARAEEIASLVVARSLPGRRAPLALRVDREGARLLA